MPVFIVHYDYGTGSTHLAIVAESKSQIEAELKFMTVVDPSLVGLDADLVRRLKLIARPIGDPLWYEVRRTTNP